MASVTPLAEGRTLLNLQYAVGFGAVFKTLYVDSIKPGATRIEAFPADLWFAIIYFALIAYFFLDWVSSNVVKEQFFPLFVLFASVFIWLLALPAILSGGQNRLGVLIFGIYLVGVSIYDFACLMGKVEDDPDNKVSFGVKECYDRMQPKGKCWFKGFAFARLLGGIAIIVAIVSSSEEVKSNAIALGAIFVFLVVVSKIGRLVLLVKNSA